MISQIDPFSAYRFAIDAMIGIVCTLSWAAAISAPWSLSIGAVDESFWSVSPWPKCIKGLVAWGLFLGLCMPTIVGLIMIVTFGGNHQETWHRSVVYSDINWVLLCSFPLGTFFSTILTDSVVARILLGAVAGRLGVKDAEIKAFQLALDSRWVAEFLGPLAWTPSGRQQILEHLIDENEGPNFLFSNLLRAYLADPKTAMTSTTWGHLLESPQPHLRQAAILATGRVV